jgi:hypothetical protein
MKQGKGNTLKIKLINIEEKPYLKKNEVCLLSPNLHPNKNIYKNEKETFYFYYTK